MLLWTWEFTGSLSTVFQRKCPLGLYPGMGLLDQLHFFVFLLLLLFGEECLRSNWPLPHIGQTLHLFHFILITYLFFDKLGIEPTAGPHLNKWFCSPETHIMSGLRRLATLEVWVLVGQERDSEIDCTMQSHSSWLSACSLDGTVFLQSAHFLTQKTDNPGPISDCSHFWDFSPNLLCVL